jgi:hypothetical protein
MTTNPIFNDNKLKLGTFCTNGRAGAAHTLVPEGNKLNWPRAGYEAVVPLAGRSAGDSRTDQSDSSTGNTPENSATR